MDKKIGVKLLSELGPGESGIVQKVTANGPLGQRLIDLGFFPGVSVTVVRSAPLLDPIDIALDGCHISIRHDEASFLEVSAS